MDMARKLRSWVKDNATASKILRHLQGRARSRESTDLYQLRREMEASGRMFTDASYYQAWEDLMGLDMGTFIQARGRQHAQFKWKYAARSVAEAALDNGALVTIKDMKTKRARPELRDPRKKRTIRIPFPLTPAEVEHYTAMIQRMTR